jgi:hypothetical protein
MQHKIGIRDRIRIGKVLKMPLAVVLIESVVT